MNVEIFDVVSIKEDTKTIGRKGGKPFKVTTFTFKTCEGEKLTVQSFLYEE